MHSNNISESPSSINKIELLMDFPTAINAVINGERITKLDWDDRSCYGMLRDGVLMLHRDEQWFQWLINDGDLLGQDWVRL